MTLLRRHAQQAGWSAAQLMRSTGGADGLPRIDFVAEAERCPLCSSTMKVHKTRSRQVITLEAGPFRAIETLKRCNEDPTHPVIGSNELAKRVKPRQRYGYDLIVQVGCARYLELKQREEIQAELHQ
ncbi:MAG: hypothetical protein GY726_12860, partial [Proteobacteria bacterium]|nr:hypothetical protein [Pseudomonadota bacterium]